MALTHGSLFSGIGGFDLGFERVGIKTLWQVECEPYCLKVLEKHWPNVRRYTDVRSVHGVLAHAESEQSGGIQQPKLSSNAGANCEQCLPVDLISGGFPCQPFSVAGKHRGTADDRHLWPQMRRVIEEVRPRWVVAENVPGLIKMALDTVLSDLEALGYTIGAITVPACAVDAPHRRERLWIVGYTNNAGNGTSERRVDSNRAKKNKGERHQPQPWIERSSTNVADSADARIENMRQRQDAISEDVADATNTDGRTNSQEEIGRALFKLGRGTGGTSTPLNWWTTEPNMGRVAHGVPARVDRLKALGNAIVPQIAEEIGRMILEVERCGNAPAVTK